MKKAIVLFTLILSVNVGFSAIIINYHKLGGGFFGYRDVSSTFMGFDQFNNQHWEVWCSGSGLNKCSRTLGGFASEDPGSEIILRHADQTLDEMNEEIDERILSGQLSGEMYKKIQYTAEDSSQKWIHIQMTWTEAENEEGHLVTATLWETAAEY